jgi:hypothetical protein
MKIRQLQDSIETRKKYQNCYTAGNNNNNNKKKRVWYRKTRQTYIDSMTSKQVEFVEINLRDVDLELLNEVKTVTFCVSCCFDMLFARMKRVSLMFEILLLRRWSIDVFYVYLFIYSGTRSARIKHCVFATRQRHDISGRIQKHARHIFVSEERSRSSLLLTGFFQRTFVVDE